MKSNTAVKTIDVDLIVDPQAIATVVWNQSLQVKAAEEALAKMKFRLIAVGGEGKTYPMNETGSEKIMVTNAGEGGPTGKYKLEFDETVFTSLPPEKREELIALGLVSMKPEVKRPYPATVRIYGQ